MVFSRAVPLISGHHLLTRYACLTRLGSRKGADVQTLRSLKTFQNARPPNRSLKEARDSIFVNHVDKNQYTGAKNPSYLSPSYSRMVCHSQELVT